MNNLILSQEDVFKFLIVAYFGSSDNMFELAGNRAYRDFCRTIHDQRFKGVTSTAKDSIRQSITSFINNEVFGLEREDVVDQAFFDEWHARVCEGIIARFSYADLHYGQAQKWVNMIFKYLCVLDLKNMVNSKYFGFLHIPIDNTIIDIATNKRLINRPTKRWSRWNIDDYQRFQRMLRNKIHANLGADYPPLLWEFRNWNATDNK